MTPNTFHIIVTGKTGTGKSAMTQLITQLLEQNGFPVYVDFYDTDPRPPEVLEKILNVIRERGDKIVVHEKNLNRQGTTLFPAFEIEAVE
jgi:CO dehydrogenase nickel-insertion accessory protein CooC1